VKVIPAIDLLDGRCVRLSQGSYSDVSVYGDDPVSVARSFIEAGARRIHLVDLDAARGSGNNRGPIARIRAAVSAVVEVGGGVRTDADVAELIDAGVDRIIVGTVLARDPGMVARWCAAHRQAADGVLLLAGIDARDGRVMIAGWEAGTGIADTELAVRAREIGCAGIIYTNIARDGMLSGPDVERTNLIAEAGKLPVVLSGGVSSADDIARAVREGHPGLQGIIVGKALYTGKVELAEAIRVASGAGGLERSEVIW